MRFVITIFFAVLFAAAAHAQKPVDSAGALKRAVAHAKSGAVIELAEGRYDLTDLKLSRDISLIGSGKVVFFSSGPVAKGILNPLPDVSLYVENIRFLGAVSPDQNGAGIRHDGDDLTIVNCVFEGNENGVLSTGAKTGRIRIRGSSFLRNGFGDGYSHGIYVVRAASLEISDSVFTGTRIGHHVKSLAERTRITGSTLDDGDGRTSYSVDASRGGDVLIADNRIVQAADGDNATIVNYDLSRGGKAIALTITHNHIVNRRANGRLLRNATDLAATLADNEIVNEAGARLDVY